MKNKNVYNMCRQVLESEIFTFESNPKDYVESMGWDSNEKIFKNINNLKRLFYTNEKDIKTLYDFVIKLNNEGHIENVKNISEVIQNLKVIDFITNWLAEHILNLLNKLTYNQVKL